MISTLIDKDDNFEIIRDKIAEIILLESKSQKALAKVAGKSPEHWDLRVFAERSNPWVEGDRVPIVNCWFDNSNINTEASNNAERQQYTGSFNIDCYGFALAENDPYGGHMPGDQKAATESHRAAKFVRNILASPIYRYLEMQGVVSKRLVSSLTSFQPQFNEPKFTHVISTRVIINVTFNELAPEYVGTILDYLSLDVTRSDTGELIAEVDFDYSV